MDASALPQKVLGKYALYDVIASGGMARIHLGRIRGPAGFSRTVAIKRLHPQYAAEPEFVAMLLDEARLSARLRHPNIVPTIDVLAEGGEVFLVMEYVRGIPFARLLRATPGEPPSPRYAANILVGVLNGLHSAHEAVDTQGTPLGLVHRDVSPQNVLVTVEGVTQVIDFGIAKAIGRLHTTRDHALKGKLSYMAPEQLRGEPVDRRTDVYAASVVLWEALTGKRLFKGDSDVEIFGKVLGSEIPPPSTLAPDIPVGLDAIVLRGLDRDLSKRFTTARDMARAIESCVPPIGSTEIGEWVQRVAAPELAARELIVAAIENASDLGWAADARPGGSTKPSDANTQNDEGPAPGAAGDAQAATAHLGPRAVAARPSRRVSLGAGVLGVVALGFALVAIVGKRGGEGPAPMPAKETAPSASSPIASSVSYQSASATNASAVTAPLMADAGATATKEGHTPTPGPSPAKRVPPPQRAKVSTATVLDTRE
jgi:serine/threonine-protein kinase